MSMTQRAYEKLAQRQVLILKSPLTRFQARDFFGSLNLGIWGQGPRSCVTICTISCSRLIDSSVLKASNCSQFDHRTILDLNPPLDKMSGRYCGFQERFTLYLHHLRSKCQVICGLIEVDARRLVLFFPILPGLTQLSKGESLHDFNKTRCIDKLPHRIAERLDRPSQNMQEPKNRMECKK